MLVFSITFSLANNSYFGLGCHDNFLSLQLYMHLTVPIYVLPPSPWSLLDCYFRILHLNKSFSVDTRCFQQACNFLPLKVFKKYFPTM